MRLSMLNRCDCRNAKTGTDKVNKNSNVGRKVIELSNMIIGENGSLRNHRRTHCTTIGYNQTNCRFILSAFSFR